MKYLFNKLWDGTVYAVDMIFSRIGSYSALSSALIDDLRIIDRKSNDDKKRNIDTFKTSIYCCARATLLKTNIIIDKKENRIGSFGQLRQPYSVSFCFFFFCFWFYSIEYVRREIKCNYNFEKITYSQDGRWVIARNDLFYVFNRNAVGYATSLKKLHGLTATTATTVIRVDRVIFSLCSFYGSNDFNIR